MDTSLQMDRVEVLLVEGDADEARRIREALRECKVDVRLRVAADGGEALSLLRAPSGDAGLPWPTLVLLDPSRAGTDAPGLLREMDADPELHHVPVVLLGDGSLPDPVPGCVRCTATLPMDLEQLFRIVESVEDLGLCIVTRDAEG